MKPRALNNGEILTVGRLIDKDVQSPLDDGKARVHGDFKHVFRGMNTIQVRYLIRDGGFTICIIEEEENNRMWVGASRKSKNDKHNRVRGEMMAFMRAIRHSPVYI